MRLWVLSILFLILAIAGCGDDAVFESEDSVPNVPAGALLANQFPTADGSSWTYFSADGERTYTSRITGTRVMNGVAVRIVENRSEFSSDTPLDVPVDYFSSLFGVPVHRNFFIKDLDSYTEHAFELWLSFLNDAFFQRNSPRRIVWSFPLYVGKEWLVQKTRLDPQIEYTRRVVSDGHVLEVPAGAFEKVYYVEEYVSIAGIQTGEESPNKYWLAPDVGVIKYEYLDPVLNTVQTYELSHFSR